jgi:hypothetical protein
MIDRRLVTDAALAVLIAFPASLPAAPNPWSADDSAGKPALQTRIAVDNDTLVRVVEHRSDAQGRS